MKTGEVFSTLNSDRFAADRLFVNFREKAGGSIPNNFGPDRTQENGLLNARAVPSEVISHKNQGTNRADARLPTEASLVYSNFLKLDPLNESLVQSNLTPKGEHIHGSSIQGGERETIKMRQEETQSVECTKKTRDRSNNIFRNTHARRSERTPAPKPLRSTMSNRSWTLRW